MSDTTTEIERKFLLSRDIEKYFLGRTSEKISHVFQAYFPSSTPEVEVRVGYRITHEVMDGQVMTHYRGGTSVKMGVGLLREEYEAPLPFEVAKRLRATLPDTVEKIRYIHEGWEIDFYQGRHKGLFIGEFELNSVDANIYLPSWLRPYIVEEVTDQIALKNAFLARIHDPSQLAILTSPEHTEKDFYV